MAAPADRVAPNPSAVAANQLVVSGNACGPTALLNAFRFGSSSWQRASDAIAGANDKERILRIIREIGMRPSKHLPGRPRWSSRGVSVADLRDMANEMVMGKYLPQLSEEVFFMESRETPEKLLRRIHRRLETSLDKGLPPVLSVRRYVQRSASGKTPAWIATEAHFVTVVALPRKLDKKARSFPVQYIDPWGGKRCEGRIAIPDPAVFTDSNGKLSCLEADFPAADVGKKKVRQGEKHTLAVSAALGRW